MVEYTLHIDSVFASLADSTRRDILRRVASRELSIGQIARKYDMSLAAVSKHLKILQQARLIVKRRQGKHFLVSASPDTIRQASAYLRDYETLWNDRPDRLDQSLLKQEL